MDFHEDLQKSEVVRGSSDRSFGLVFAAAILLIAIWPMHTGGSVRKLLLAPASLMLAVAWLRPWWLHRLNRGWIRVGVVMGKVVNPFVTGVLFFGVFTPAALFLRMRGKDALRLRFDPKAESYWIRRPAAGADEETMAKQF